MAKSALDSKTKRLALAAEQDHSEVISAGRYLVYRRPRSGAAGSWSARHYTPATKKIKRQRLGVADDFTPADGAVVLTYDQAVSALWRWCKRQDQEAIRAAGGEVPQEGPYTVAQAMAAYLEHLEKKGARSKAVSEFSINAHILPELGALEVGRLTRRTIETWHKELAEKGRRSTGKRREEPVLLDPPTTEDAKRARKDTANRILTVLKAGLNLAHTEGLVEATPWRDVRPFQDVARSRVRFLSLEEQTRLLAACEGDFAALVRGALLTGARYGELCRCKVQDFDPAAGTLYIERGKTGKPRHVRLSKQAVTWFKEHAKGRPSSAPLFPHSGAARVTRTSSDDWMPYDQVPRMRDACVAAGLDPLGFHELRHTYASSLVNAGMPLLFVAAQLGHTSTRMVEKHYGHLAPSALAKAVDKYSPKILGL